MGTAKFDELGTLIDAPGGADVLAGTLQHLADRGLVIDHQAAIFDREQQHLLDVFKAAARFHLHNRLGLREGAGVRKEEPEHCNTSSNHVVPRAEDSRLPWIA